MERDLAIGKPLSITCQLFINRADVSFMTEKLLGGQEFKLDHLFINGQSCPEDTGYVVESRLRAASHSAIPDGMSDPRGFTAAIADVDGDENAAYDDRRQESSEVIEDFQTAKRHLKTNFDRRRLRVLISRFRSAVKRGCDDQLACELDEDLLASDTPELRTITVRRLAEWCDTNGIYADGMEVAKDVSLLLFGQVLNRRRLGV